MFLIFLEYLSPYVLVICLIVTVHEFGHYVVARLCGVKVRAFSVGFGPELFGFTSSSGTRWKISLIPLGGYVGFIEDEADKNAFASVNAWKKILISLAGPLANGIAAVLIFIFLFYTTCVRVIDPVVSSIVSGSPADIAGIKPKDRLLSIDAVNISNVGDVYSYLNSNITKEMKVILSRDHVGTLTVKVVPQTRYVVNNFGIKKKIASIGVSFNNSTVRLQYRSISESFLNGLNYSFYIIQRTIVSLYNILTGSIKADQMAGPIIIAKLAKEFASEGFNAYIEFVAILSISIGLFNLLPIPLLDGGNFVVFLLEIIRGKPIGKSAETIIMMIGLLVVITLSVLIISNDIYRLIGWFLEMNNGFIDVL